MSRPVLTDLINMESCELFVHLLVSKLAATLVADKYTFSQTS